MDENLSEIARYYNEKSTLEWNRLERHRIEFELTMRAILERIPQPPLRILDCGGGPGRYAIELARRGYQVTLFDLSPGNLELGQAKAQEAGVRLEALELGTATDLSRFSNGEANGFDAVLMFGPLYHLLQESARRQALSEARRVLKPGGWLFAAWINRYAPFRDQAANMPLDLMQEWETHLRILREGLLQPRPEKPDSFIAYFAHPQEVELALWAAGFEVDEVLAIEGLLAPYEEGLTKMPNEVWAAFMDLNYLCAPDPYVYGCCDHLLAAARRPAWRWVLAGVVSRLENAGIDYRIVGGACLALHGVPVPVEDIDLETDKAGAYQIEQLFSEHVALPVSLSENDTYRSHFGRLDFDGVKMEVMGDLHRRAAEGWTPTATQTEAVVRLSEDGDVLVRVSWLEEEVLAYLRRGRLDRAADCLHYCSQVRLLSLLRGEQPTSVL